MPGALGILGLAGWGLGWMGDYESKATLPTNKKKSAIGDACCRRPILKEAVTYLYAFFCLTVSRGCDIDVTLSH